MALSCFKNAIRRKKLILLPSLFYISGGLTEMLHTILELADYPIRISVAIDVHIRLRHTYNMLYAEKLHIKE